MPAQARALLSEQILSFLISITYKSLMVSQPSMCFWKECGFHIFLFIHSVNTVCRRTTEKPNQMSTLTIAMLLFLQIPNSPLT